jgi:multidrug efflux pump subunit AcrB
MKQVAGAVLSSTLVLVAVFAPVSFLGGMTGELYRQFAVTISVSVVVSGVVALTLTPAMCALLLDRQHHSVPRPFAWFNTAFEYLTGICMGGRQAASPCRYRFSAVCRNRRAGHGSWLFECHPDWSPRKTRG